MTKKSEAMDKPEEKTSESGKENCIGLDFISDVAHELRTPIAVLRGALEALCDGVVCEKEKVGEYHRHMLSESIYLQRLVNDLLEYSRLQNSGFKIFKEPVNVCDVISDVCRSAGSLAVKRNIKIIREVSSYVYMINGDYARLRQMFTVVLDNAVKFSGDDQKVLVEEKINGEKLIVSIKDNGCGIAAEDLDNIFKKFHRVMSVQNRSGSGLGLPIAREIADRHGAEISVDSKQGRGTVFTFTFCSENADK